MDKLPKPIILMIIEYGARELMQTCRTYAALTYQGRYILYHCAVVREITLQMKFTDNEYAQFREIHFESAKLSIFRGFHKLNNYSTISEMQEHKYIYTNRYYTCRTRQFVNVDTYDNFNYKADKNKIYKCLKCGIHRDGDKLHSRKSCLFVRIHSNIDISLKYPSIIKNKKSNNCVKCKRGVKHHCKFISYNEHGRDKCSIIIFK